MGREGIQLNQDDREKATAHTQPRARVIHEIVRQQGEEELQRKTNALGISAFAAGLSMGFSFLAMAMIWARLPDMPWRLLIASPGYATGFLIVILGRQQLFTESTLTALLPALTRPGLATIAAASRVWIVVLLANLGGTWLFAWVLSHDGIFSPEIWRALKAISSQGDQATLVASFMKAIMAGWLIALMVWLLPGAGSARILIIVILTAIVALGTMPHIVAGSVEAAWSVLVGQSTIARYLQHFFLPTLLGNTAGGVALTAMLNHGPLASELHGD